MAVKKKELAYEQHMAESFASAASEALGKGESGRAVMLYEHALNFQINAINLASEEGAGVRGLVGKYRQAVIYASKCGRQQKARHLIHAVLMLDIDQAQREEFEELAEQIQ